MKIQDWKIIKLDSGHYYASYEDRIESPICWSKMWIRQWIRGYIKKNRNVKV